MKPAFKVNHIWVLWFLIKILGLLVVLNLIVFPVLWVLGVLYLLAVVLTYEGFFVTFLGALQVLASYIYRENSSYYRGGFRTRWFDFKKFAKLKPEEREKYRQQGIIMVLIGLVFLVGIAIGYFCLLASS